MLEENFLKAFLRICSLTYAKPAAASYDLRICWKIFLQINISILDVENMTYVAIFLPTYVGYFLFCSL